MKPNIHPKWYPAAKVSCACGSEWTVGATEPEIRVNICSSCHPFFTGEQRIVDTEGQVDRFIRRLKAREDIQQETQRRAAELTSPELALTELGLGTRIENLLAGEGFKKVGDVLELLQTAGEEGLTDIRGLGLTYSANLKKSLRARGYILPDDEQAEESA
ncbi:MAG TPA: 50S ribosomal protein L31 [Thermoflexia bacterium]|nr:50S ribosomal protein L31 [Thermoflexia bacterium]